MIEVTLEDYRIARFENSEDLTWRTYETGALAIALNGQTIALYPEGNWRSFVVITKEMTRTTGTEAAIVYDFKTPE